MTPLKLAMLGLAVVAAAGVLPPGAATADEVCAKKCYKAQTCPIVGSKCLDFDWCRDECHDDGERTLKDEELKDIPKLPGAAQEKLKI